MIKIDLNKTKDYLHTLRRQIRSEEFKPYDDIISKQIPGEALTTAESERQKIREKHAVLQEEINSKNDVQDLEPILKSFYTEISNLKIS